MGFRRAWPELTMHTSHGRSRMMYRSDGATLTSLVYSRTGAWPLVGVSISTRYVYTARGINPHQEALPLVPRCKEGADAHPNLGLS